MVNTTGDAGVLIEGLSALDPDIRAVLVENALRDAENTPGSVNIDGEKANLTDQSATDSRTVVVFSTISGEPHVVLRRMRRYALSLRRQDGRPAFWAPGMPGRPPRVLDIGDRPFKCALSHEGVGSPEDRALADECGYSGRYCNDLQPDKSDWSGLSLRDKQQHEERKHPNFFSARKALIDDRRQTEALELARQTAAAQIELANVLKQQNNRGRQQG